MGPAALATIVTRHPAPMSSLSRRRMSAIRQIAHMTLTMMSHPIHAPCRRWLIPDPRGRKSGSMRTQNLPALSERGRPGKDRKGRVSSCAVLRRLALFILCRRQLGLHGRLLLLRRAESPTNERTLSDTRMLDVLKRQTASCRRWFVLIARSTAMSAVVTVGPVE